MKNSPIQVGADLTLEDGFQFDTPALEGKMLQKAGTVTEKALLLHPKSQSFLTDWT